MIKELMRKTNIFAFDNFLRSNGGGAYSSVCGGLVSLPLLALIIILLVLKLVQMVNYGIVMTNTQTTYTYEPPLTTFSTSQKDPEYAPFMLAFSVNIDNAVCPNSAIIFEAFVNEYSGQYNTVNRTQSKVPLNYQNCTADHFAMLPGKLGKLNQWASNTLHCLPANSYFQIGGSNTISDLYKNIQYRFACPSNCSASTCGYVEFFSASSTVNLGNASSPYSYSLTRHRFSIQSAPKYQTSLQIDSSNMTSDNSILPFSLDHKSFGASVSNVVTDIPLASGDTNNYVTVERSDKTTIFMRSYYKVFDLLAYMGGVLYGILVFLFFIRNFSKIEFQLNFAAEYFRISDSKQITFRGYLKQLFYELVKNTRWRPDWRMAEEREQSREAANRVLDVVYLNKRIAFLEEAISLIFEKHQLKGIHLLHSLKKEEVKGQIVAHKFRDRVVYFLGKKYRHREGAKVYKDIRYQGSQMHKSSLANSNGQLIKNENIQYLPQSLESGSDNQQPNQKLIKQKEEIFKHKDLKVSFSQQLAYPKIQNQLQSVKPMRLTLKNLITNKIGDQQERLNVQSDANLIVNEAQGYYSELAEYERAKKIIVNSRQDNTQLRNELNFIGDLSYEQLNELHLVEELQTDMRQLVDEGERNDGSQLTKKIYDRLDNWLKNYLRDTVKGSEL